jgi:hypothetical protein
MVEQVTEEGLLDELGLDPTRQHEIYNLDRLGRVPHQAETHGAVRSVFVRASQNVFS